jgi:hypothetical protein
MPEFNYRVLFSFNCLRYVSLVEMYTREILRSLWAENIKNVCRSLLLASFPLIHLLFIIFSLYLLKFTFNCPDEVDFFNLPNPSNSTMALGSTQPLTEMSTRNLPGGKRRPARKADNLTAICEPTV